MVVTRSGKLSSKILSPERRAYTQPSTPHTDSTVPMSSIYGDMEARILHHFMGGIDLDETGAAQRQEVTDWAQLWTKLDRFVGYTGDEGCHVLSFNKSTRRGECGLNADGTFILFPLFLRGGSLDESGMRDRDVIEVVQFPKPTIMDKRFFKKMFLLDSPARMSTSDQFSAQSGCATGTGIVSRGTLFNQTAITSKPLCSSVTY